MEQLRRHKAKNKQKKGKRQRGGRAESAPGTVGFQLLTQSVSGDGGQGQRVVAHRLILDYLQIKTANETNEFPGGSVCSSCINHFRSGRRWNQSGWVFIIWTAAELMALLRYRCPFFIFQGFTTQQEKRPVN